MAELVFSIPDVTMTATWQVKYPYVPGESSFSGVLYSATSASASRTVAISGIPDGENVKRAMLTATLSYSGKTAGSETFTVNSLSFYTGTRKMDTSEFANNSDWTASFSYYCDCGDASSRVSTVPDAIESSSRTVYVTDITLTLTTGTGSAFDGEIGSLPEGTKILIDEPDGVQGTYSIVHHGYGDTTLCLLWRDNCISTTKALNHNEDRYTKDNYGQIDLYLSDTFYVNMPDTTKPYIQEANYPTLSSRLYGGTVSDLYRYVCTPSVRELKETVNAAEWHGLPLDYLETVNCGEVYWTRSIATSSAGYGYRISDSDGGYYTFSRDYASGIRPCFCVLEEQLVTPGDADATYYVLTSAVDAPADVYLNGAASDLSGQQRDTSATLSWDAVASTLVTGYEVWSCDTVDGEYAFLGAVTASDDGTIPTELTVRTGGKGFAELYFKVKAITTPDTDYLDSDLSANHRVMATKRTNVHYYDGTRWLLAMPNHYGGSAWTQTEGMQYYDGSQWIVPGA